MWMRRTNLEQHSKRSIVVIRQRSKLLLLFHSRVAHFCPQCNNCKMWLISCDVTSFAPVPSFRIHRFLHDHQPSKYGSIRIPKLSLALQHCQVHSRHDHISPSLSFSFRFMRKCTRAVKLIMCSL